LPGEPFLDAATTGVVSGCGKTEIAEIVAELAQQPCRCGQRFERIEGIVEPDFGRVALVPCVGGLERPRQQTRR
jgi:hypothetical protein